MLMIVAVCVEVACARLVFGWKRDRTWRGEANTRGTR